MRGVDLRPGFIGDLEQARLDRLIEYTKTFPSAQTTTAQCATLGQLATA